MRRVSDHWCWQHIWTTPVLPWIADWGRRCALCFNGRVADAYFRKGARVCLHPGHVPAQLVRPLRGEERRFEFQLRSPEVAPVFAVWELEEFALRTGRIHGRACDDLIGCAAVLATLRELQRRRAVT